MHFIGAYLTSEWYTFEMMRVTKYLTRTILLVWLFLMVSCYSKIYDPDYQHSGFLVGLKKNEGRNFSAMRNLNGNLPDASLLSANKLTNGHIVYKYQGKRTCRYMVEVDSASDIIVGTDWEGEKSDCIHVP
jgi:hypothetical protein